MSHPDPALGKSVIPIRFKRPPKNELDYKWLIHIWNTSSKEKLDLANQLNKHKTTQKIRLSWHYTIQGILILVAAIVAAHEVKVVPLQIAAITILGVFSAGLGIGIGYRFTTAIRRRSTRGVHR